MTKAINMYLIYHAENIYNFYGEGKGTIPFVLPWCLLGTVFVFPTKSRWEISAVEGLEQQGQKQET